MIGEFIKNLFKCKGRQNTTSDPKPKPKQGDSPVKQADIDQIVAIINASEAAAVTDALAAVSPAPVQFTQADVDAAKAQGFADGQAAGIAAEKAKVAADLAPVNAEVAPSA